MPLVIDDPVADELAHELAARTGEDVTQTVITSIRERLERQRRVDELRDKLLAIGKEFAALPDRDTRSADEILGYNEYGGFD